MKRAEVIKRLRRAAKDAGVEFEIVELTNHTGIVVGGKLSGGTRRSMR